MTKTVRLEHDHPVFRESVPAQFLRIMHACALKGLSLSKRPENEIYHRLAGVIGEYRDGLKNHELTGNEAIREFASFLTGALWIKPQDVILGEFDKACRHVLGTSDPSACFAYSTRECPECGDAENFSLGVMTMQCLLCGHVYPRDDLVQKQPHETQKA